jgi:hypothetical protein
MLKMHSIKNTIKETKPPFKREPIAYTLGHLRVPLYFISIITMYYLLLHLYNNESYLIDFLFQYILRHRLATMNKTLSSFKLFL